MTFRIVTEHDIEPRRAFLRDADLTVAGLDEPTVRLWIEQDEVGTVIGSTGFELSRDGTHALSFFGLALYVTVDAGLTLAGLREAEHSTVVIILAAVSLAVMPFLSLLERRTG